MSRMILLGFQQAHVKFLPKLNHMDTLIGFGFIFSLPFVSLPLSSMSLSPFTVMEYYIDILGVWGRAMTLQLFYPFQMQ